MMKNRIISLIKSRIVVDPYLRYSKMMMPLVMVDHVSNRLTFLHLMTRIFSRK